VVRWSLALWLSRVVVAAYLRKRNDPAMRACICFINKPTTDISVEPSILLSSPALLSLLSISP